MKVELQSDSSGFGDFEDPSLYKPNPTFDPRKKLWNNYKDGSDPFKSSSGFSSHRKESNLSDDDFEFVITRSTTAKKVKKPNLDTHDNYMRFNDNREFRNRMNGYVDSPFDTPSRSTKQNTHRKSKREQTKGHPGLERNLDFDPFGSDEDDSSDTSDVYDVNRYASQSKDTPFEPEDYPPPTPEANYCGYATSQVRRRSSCTLIFTKIKTFFKSVGFMIKKSFSKSRTYFSRMIENNKNRRRNKKSKESLLTNQQYYTDADNEQMSTPSSRKTNSVYRQKLDVPFNLNSESDFEELNNVKPKKKKFKFPGFRTKQFKKMKFVGPKKSMKPVKLHSFPD